jgi:hypothetical protein
MEDEQVLAGSDYDEWKGGDIESKGSDDVDGVA